MDPLIEAALAYVPRDRPFRALVAPAGDGARLVALATAMAAEARHAALDDAARADAVMARLRGADRTNLGATDALAAWSGGRHDIVSFGEPLTFASEPVQGELFGATVVRRPPAAFDEGPYDLVVADIPRGELTADERDRMRHRFDALSGQFTEEVPLIERLAGLVRSGGVLALRVRRAILRREFGRALVRELGRRMQVLGIDEDAGHIIAVLRATGQGDGAVLLRVFGSEAAARVLRAMEQGSRHKLSERVETAIGPTSYPGYDEVWQPPMWLEHQLPTMPHIRGVDIDAWRVNPSAIVWPYDEDGHRRTPPDELVVRVMSRFRVLLEGRELFGRTLQERDVRWYEYLEHHRERWARLPAVVIARIGTHPRVAIVREPSVVSGSALVLNPASDVDPYFLAGLLGSRAAGFWMKQAFHIYETDRGTTFELTAAGLADFPIPAFHQGVADTARALERLARSIRPLSAVIDGDPERLAARLDGAIAANADLRRQCQKLAADLDAMVLDAYGLDATLIDEPMPSFDAQPNERDVLLDWLVDVVADGFSTHELPTNRPVPDTEVADWLRKQPLCRAVLARLDADAVDVLMRGAVPSEAELTFSRSGLDKLRAWASGEPTQFHRADYSGTPLAVPAVSASLLRQTIWRWRGRFNAPREPFVLLGALSRDRGRPYFAWAGAEVDTHDDSAPRARAQVDLELLLQLLAQLDTPQSQAQLADAAFTKGWSSVDVQLALQALERNGAIVERGGTWRRV